MRRRVVLRPAAVRDLDRLYDFIFREAGPATAIGYIRRIRAHCEGLADFPERGLARDGIRPGLRVTGLERRVAIAFSFDATTVRIARIFYGRRDYEALLRAPDKKPS